MSRFLKEFATSIRDGIKSDQPLQVGRALTKLFLVIVCILAILPQYTAEGGWNIRLLAFLTAPANEIGDTFAGVAGVLAFLWIIITVWLQSQELSAQREELKLTRLEMEEQRIATQELAQSGAKQAEISQLQIDIYRDERDQRNQAYAQSQAKELYAHTHDFLVDLLISKQKFASKSGKKIEVQLLNHFPVNVASGRDLKQLSTKVLLNGLLKAIQSISPDNFPEEDIEPSAKLVRLHRHLALVASLAEAAGPVSKSKFEDEGVNYALIQLDIKFGRPT